MIKYLSLFSGIGAFEKALENIGVPYELIAYCEVDKFASKAYSLLHNTPESLNLGDITKVDESKLPENIDLITYGFPCQDISIAGKRKGFLDEKGTKTRSGLFFDALRIIEHCKPQNRERVFIVSIRKDVDEHTFQFPDTIQLEKCMGDFLDVEVPKEFYLSPQKTQKVIEHNAKHLGQMVYRGGICTTLLSRDKKDPKVVSV